MFPSAFAIASGGLPHVPVETGGWGLSYPVHIVRLASNRGTISIVFSSRWGRNSLTRIVAARGTIPPFVLRMQYLRSPTNSPTFSVIQDYLGSIVPFLVQLESASQQQSTRNPPDSRIPAIEPLSNRNNGYTTVSTPDDERNPADSFPLAATAYFTIFSHRPLHQLRQPIPCSYSYQSLAATLHSPPHASPRGTNPEYPRLIVSRISASTRLPNIRVQSSAVFSSNHLQLLTSIVFARSPSLTLCKNPQSSSMFLAR